MPVKKAHFLSSKMKLSCLLHLCIIIVLIPKVVSAPSSYAAVTPSPYYYYPVATENPVQRTQPMPTHKESQDIDYYEYDTPTSAYPTIKSSNFSPSQLLLTLLRTFVDVLRRVNSKRSQSGSTKIITHNNSTLTNSTRTERLPSSNVTRKVFNQTTSVSEEGRGMDPGVIYDDYPHHHDDYPHHHDDYPHHHDEPHMPEPPPPPPVEEPKEVVKQSRYSDPWEGYYEFIITEGSFKFWSFFQLATSGLLLYSALAAIYYAKFNPIQPDYDTTYDDYFFGRSLEGDAPMLPPDSATPAPGWLSGLSGMGQTTFQRIMDAISMTEDKLG